MGTTATGIQTSWSMLKRKDMRRHRRYAVDAGVLQVSWIDSAGKMKMTRSRALNISEGGMALELPEAALPLSMVRFESSRFHIISGARAGFGIVAGWARNLWSASSSPTDYAGA